MDQHNIRQEERYPNEYLSDSAAVHMDGLRIFGGRRLCADAHVLPRMLLSHSLGKKGVCRPDGSRRHRAPLQIQRFLLPGDVRHHRIIDFEVRQRESVIYFVLLYIPSPQPQHLWLMI